MIDEVTFAGANLLHQYGQGVAGEEADQQVAPGLVDWAVQKIRGLLRGTAAEPAYDRLIDGQGQDGDPELVVAALRDAVADDPRHLQTLVDVVRHLRAAGIEFPGTLPPVGADDLLRVRFARPTDPDGEAVPGQMTRLDLHLENRSDRATRVILRPFGDHAAQVRIPSTVEIAADDRVTVPVLFEVGTIRPAAGRAVVRVAAESPELGRRTSARTVEIPARSDWSLSLDPRASLGRAHPTPVTLRVRNTGNTTWVRPVIELSGDDRVELAGDTEHPLGEELLPGSEATVRFGAQAATLVGTVPAEVRVELRINGNGELPARTVSLPVRPLLPAGIAVATVATALGAVLILPAGDRFAAMPGSPGDPFRPSDSGPSVTVSPTAPPSITPSVRPTSRPTSAPPRSPTPSVRPTGPAVRTSGPPAPGPGPSAAGVDLLFAAPAQDPVILRDREGQTVTLPAGGAVRQAVKVPTGWLVLRTVSAGTGGVLYVHNGQTDQLYAGTNDRAWVDDGGGKIVVDRRPNNTAGQVVVHTLTTGGQTAGTLPADADVLGFVGGRILLRVGSGNGFDTWQPGTTYTAAPKAGGTLLGTRGDDAILTFARTGASACVQELNAAGGFQVVRAQCDLGGSVGASTLMTDSWSGASPTGAALALLASDGLYFAGRDALFRTGPAALRPAVGLPGPVSDLEWESDQAAIVMVSGAPWRCEAVSGQCAAWPVDPQNGTPLRDLLTRVGLR